MKAFLFSDIESSTRLWEDDPEAMREALQRHFEILGEAVRSAGGTVLKNTGDGIVAVFDDPPASVAASVAAQRAISREVWRTPREIRVRIGLHAGDADPTRDDYFGPAMNRAARIMSAAHGGQVLVSGQVADRSAAKLPEGVTLVDLGEHRLKDLTDPEHLFQVTHPDLHRDFPALLTLEASPNNLPHQTTEFLGRNDELNAVEALLMAPATRLVTIVGPGGAGKTRLGLQVAAELSNRFRDGVFFVDLAAEHDADSAYEAVVRSLGLLSVRDQPLDLLRVELRDKDMLLLLDNFEQITVAGSGVVSLLESCPRLKVLVTSRETLRVRGEQVFPVPPMRLPDPGDTQDEIAGSEAVQLFVERARSVQPRFALTPDNAPIIARICLRLDGLPLAIELAAARLNVFNPEGLLDRLSQRLDVLGSGGRDLPDRQRTLWSAIGWSYELLTAVECRVVELMSVFSSARLEAIEAVAAQTLDSADLFETLASLVDKSLVRSEDVNGVRRFSMLLTIKEFTADRLAANPDFEEAVRRAHADYYRDYTAQLSAGLSGPARHDVLAGLPEEIGNLRAAWRYWVATGDVEQISELLESLWALHDASGWYHAAVELASDALGVLARAEPSEELVAEELALRTRLARGLLAVRGYDVEVEEAFKKVLAMAEATGDGSQQAPVMRALASYYQHLAQWEDSLEIGRRLGKLAEEAQDPSMMVEAQFLIGTSLTFTGQLEEGFAVLDECIDATDVSPSEVGRLRLGPHTGVSARVASGMLRWRCGAIDRGVSTVREALILAERLEHPYSIAYALHHNAFMSLGRKRFDESRAMAVRLRDVASEHDYLVWQTLATVIEGVSLTFMGDAETGVPMTERGVELYQGLTTPPVFWPLILHLRGIVHGFTGDQELGLSLIDEAISLGDERGFPDFQVSRADVMLMSGPDPAAERWYQRAIDAARQSGLRTVELQACMRLVDLRRTFGASPDGSDELRAVYSTFNEGLDEVDLVQAREILGVDPAEAAASPRA